MSKIVSSKKDFSKWYTSILTEADLVDYGLVKGTIVFKPYAWKIWTNIQKELDKELKKLGVENCCFPLMIPYSEFKREAKHVEGFAPELFRITKIGDKELSDDLVVRPTSEISFCKYFSSNSKSYNDLPMKLNQWCNVFRVEKNTRPFLRTSEFFWQETHAIFETKKEAQQFALDFIRVYEKFLKETLCIPVIVGEKTEYERFAGASNTYTIEALMKDGQALQSGTSHFLDQNFSKNFDIKYQTKDNSFDYVYQTSHGVSTRLIGALIMTHSDDNGLVLPSKIAPFQIVVITDDVDNFNKTIKPTLDSMNHIDYKVDSTNKSLGIRIGKYEVMGVPLQFIIGRKEMEEKTVTFYNRVLKEKNSIKLEQLNKEWIDKTLSNLDKTLYDNASKFLNDSIVEVNNIEEFKKAINDKKMVLAYWSGSQEDEKKLKELTQATTRCISWTKKSEKDKKCFFTNKPNAQLVYFARSY